jgi:aromatic ring-opening dioxygenase LigB subunit
MDTVLENLTLRQLQEIEKQVINYARHCSAAELLRLYKVIMEQQAAASNDEIEAAAMVMTIEG